MAELGELPQPMRRRSRPVLKDFRKLLAFVAPIGPSAWNLTKNKRRSAAGSCSSARRSTGCEPGTRDSGRPGDRGPGKRPFEISRGVAAGIAPYARCLKPPASRLVLEQLPPSHREGPILLNVRRISTCLERWRWRPNVRRWSETASPETCAYAVETAERLGWKAPGGAPRVNVVKTEPLQAE